MGINLKQAQPSPQMTNQLKLFRRNRPDGTNWVKQFCVEEIIVPGDIVLSEGWTRMVSLEQLLFIENNFLMQSMSGIFKMGIWVRRGHGHMIAGPSITM